MTASPRAGSTMALGRHLPRPSVFSALIVSTKGHPTSPEDAELTSNSLLIAKSFLPYLPLLQPLRLRQILHRTLASALCSVKDTNTGIRYPLLISSQQQVRGPYRWPCWLQGFGHTSPTVCNKSQCSW
jgi:hypothetical protein